MCIYVYMVTRQMRMTDAEEEVGRPWLNLHDKYLCACSFLSALRL